LKLVLLFKGAGTVGIDGGTSCVDRNFNWLNSSLQLNAV